MALKKPIEYVIPLVVASGNATNQKTMSLPQGRIKCFTAIFRDYSGIQPGFVRAGVQDANGTEVSLMQSIDNLATRQGGDYYSSKKPLPCDAGQSFTVTVQATANFTGNFLVDFLFVFEPEENCEN